mgnify:CR=1 FL=1
MLPRHGLSSLALGATLALFGATANAQYIGGSVSVTTQPVYAQPQPVVVQQQPVYAQPQPVVVQQQQPVYVQQQPVYVQQRQPVYVQSGGRFRWGLDAGVGWTFLGSLSGFGITASLRLGWQLSDEWAVFYQGDLPIGFASGTYSGREYSGAAIVLGSGIMGEYTLNDLLSFAVGPSLDYAAGLVCGTTSSSCIGEGGAYFGLQGRISLNLGSQLGENTRRRAFRLGVSSHTTFYGDVGVFQAINLHAGYEFM